MKITSPVKGYNESTEIGPYRFDFVDGEAEYDEDKHGKLNDGVKAYLEDQGYGLGSKAAQAPDVAPEPADPRKVGDEQVGTKMRDAAVDPQPGDFLAPTNAGKANPHGSQVVNPEIHASEGVRPVKAGAVHVDDSAAQDKAEKEHAAAATDGTPVEVTPGEKRDVIAAGGPGLTLGQSDPDGKVEPMPEPEPTEDNAIEVPEGDTDARIAWVHEADDQGEATRRANALHRHATEAGDTDLEELGVRLRAAVYGNGGGSTEPEPDVELKGQALEDALEQRGLPKTGTADEKRARVAEHDDAAKGQG